MGLRPFHYLLLYRLVPLCYYLLRCYLYLLRIRVVGEEIALGCLADYGRLIVAVWHQVSGAVILPVIVSANKAWIIGSWDEFLVPKPFSEVTIEWGQPFVVPRDIDPTRFEELRKEIEQSLSEGYAEADLSSGWKHPL